MVKTTTEIIPLVVDFVNVMNELPSNQVIQSSSFVTITEAVTGTDRTSSMLVSSAVSGTQIQSFIQGGTCGKHYNVRFNAITQNCRIEITVDLQVTQ